VRTSFRQLREVWHAARGMSKSAGPPQLRKMETGLGVSDANFPLDAEGRTYHVGVKQGEVAARVVTVGDPSRAATLAGFFDRPESTLVLQTNRGFTTYTGSYRGVPVSVVATGMGVAMMDFMVREVAAVTPGPMVVVRFGTCGTLDAGLPVGSLCLASGAVMCRRNEDAWATGSAEAPYTVSKRAVAGDARLLKRLHERVRGAVDVKHALVEGLNCTADSFYSTQGRLGTHFDDRNAELFRFLVAQHAQLKTLEMETFQLFHLAECSKERRIHAAALCIVLANRSSNDFLTVESKHYLEQTAGRAILEAIVDFKLE
jgi:uridine phosphorylase